MSMVNKNKMDAEVFKSQMNSINDLKLIKAEISGDKVFDYNNKPSEVQKLMLSAMISAGIYRREIFTLAQRVAEHFNVKISSNYWFIVEIIESYLKGKDVVRLSQL